MSLHHDLRLSFRSLRRAPGFFALATLLLAVGIGSTLYMFGAINGYVLRPLPYPDADRLVHAGTADPAYPEAARSVPAEIFFRLRDEGVSSLDALEGWYSGTANVSGRGTPERFKGAFVSPGLLPRVGGERPLLGQGFRADDAAPGAPAVLLLSYETWRDRFGSDEAIVGTALRLNGEPATVVGVMPPKFRFPADDDLWVALRPPASGDVSRVPGVEVLGRLRRGATRDAVRAELDTAFASLSAELHPGDPAPRSIVRPLSWEFVDRGTRRMLTLMFVATVLILLIACADVANLLFVRGLGRRRELAVRAALGAPRGRLIAAGLLEGALVTGVASVFGLLGASWAAERTIARLRAAEFMDVAPWVDITIDARSLAFTVGLAAVVVLAAALAPAFASSRTEAVEALRQSGRGAVGTGLGRASRTLVVAQIALSVALVACASLAAAGVRALGGIPVGVAGEEVLGARVALSERDFPDDDARLAFFRRAEAELGRLPGVVRATVTTSLPATLAERLPVEIEGIETRDDAGPRALLVQASASYFETVGQSVVAGRRFLAGEGERGERIAIVNRRFADVFLGGADPLDRRIRFRNAMGDGFLRVVGVVSDVDHDDIEDGADPTVYVPLAQLVPQYAFLAVRGEGDASRLGPDFRRRIAEIAPDLPLYWVRTVAQWFDTVTFSTRFLARLFAGFAAIGLLLAGAGLYGILAFTVTRRTGEIGLRRALGAPDLAVARWIASDKFLDLAIGLACGGALAALLVRPLSTFFYGVQPWDPGTWLAIVPVLALATALAALVPTLRALAIEPATALREE